MLGKECLAQGVALLKASQDSFKDLFVMGNAHRPTKSTLKTNLKAHHKP